jgi:ubiquinol-cytochrome c reductase cytochrome b subunit
VAGAQLLGKVGAPFSPDVARSTTLLSRLHSMHVSLLPLLLFALIGLHFWLIRYLGLHTGTPRTTTFSRFVPRLAGYGLLLIALVGVLAALFPPGIGHPSVEGVEVTKPFWPFLWIYAAENTMGLWGMVLAPLVIFGFLFLIPLLDRRPDGVERPRWLFALAVLMLALYVGGIIYGVFAPQMQHLGM